MSTEVDICNLALAHLGDTATVASIDPPEGSAQAEHCARFYPMARDALLEEHPWGFATKRVALALLSEAWPEWTYAYAQPNDAVNIIAILSPTATDDYSQGIINIPDVSIAGNYEPQPFSCEINDDGVPVILSDQEDAVLRYTALVSDTGNFSPLFTTTLSWRLAALLAGPILKGDVGAAEAKRCEAMAQAYLSKAIESDAGQRRINPVHKVGWINGR